MTETSHETQIDTHLAFRVFGEPKPKGAVRPVPIRKHGQVVASRLVDDSQSRPWAALVTDGARQAAVAWRLGRNGSIVSNHPVDGMKAVDGMKGSEEVAYYGGHCICESVTQANAALIIKAVNTWRAESELPARCPGWHLEDDDQDDQDDRDGGAFFIAVAIVAGTLVLAIGLVYALLRLVLG